MVDEMRKLDDFLLALLRQKLISFVFGVAIVVSIIVWFRGCSDEGTVNVPRKQMVVQIGNTENDDRRCDVVFVHGLGGDGSTTWLNSETNFYWPQALAKVMPNAGVWVVNYDAQISEWLGNSMPIQDRSKNLLQNLKVNRIGERPIVFITHSLGGLVVKQMLRDAITSGTNEWSEIGENCKGVVFLAVPNTGSDMALYLNNLAKVLPVRTTQTASDLQRNSAHLRDLGSWYRNNVEELGIQTKAFFENNKIHGILVVDQSSGDPNAPGTTAIAVDEDHLSICKPQEAKGLVFDTVKDFLDQEVAPLPRKCVLSYSEFVAAFNRVRFDPPRLQVFAREHTGQLVEWDVKIYSINPPPHSSLVIIASDSINDNDAIVASFYPSRFKSMNISLGQKIKIRAVIKYIKPNGTNLNPSKVLE